MRSCRSRSGARLAGAFVIAVALLPAAARAQCSSGCESIAAAQNKTCVASLANETGSGQPASSHFAPACTASGVYDVNHATRFDLAPGTQTTVTHVCIGVLGNQIPGGLRVGLRSVANPADPLSGVVYFQHSFPQHPQVSNNRALVPVNPPVITGSFWVIVTYVDVVGGGITPGGLPQIIAPRTGGRAMLRINDNCFGNPFWWLGWTDYDDVAQFAPAYAGFGGQAPVIRPLRLVSTPGASCQIIATPASGLTTTENGHATSFQVRLSAQPGTAVTVRAQTSDISEGLIRLPGGQSVPSRDLTFTSLSWQVPQTVEVVGIDDAILDGHWPYGVNLSVLAGPTCYQGKTATVAIENLDNDAPGGAPPSLGWLQAGVPGPAARRLAATTFHSGRQTALLFGGRNASGTAFGDTWQWPNGSWSDLMIAGPSGRWSSAMAYDPSRDVVVLFGGHAPGGTSLGDTWELSWNGSAWVWAQQVPAICQPGTPPVGRGEHAMAYDPVGQRVIMYGGRTNGGAGTVLSDTWSYDNGQWCRLSDPGPPGQRRGHVLITDPARNRIVLFGGSFTGAQDGRTYAWNGAAWSQVATTGPAEREQLAGAFYGLRSTPVIHGGFFGATMYNDTWELTDPNGATWAPLPTLPLSPPGGGSPQRAMHRIFFDEGSGQMVMFGGINASNQDQGQTRLLPGTQSCRFFLVTGTGTGAPFNLSFVHPSWSVATPSIALAPGASPAQIVSALAQSLNQIGATQGGLSGARPVAGAPSVLQVCGLAASAPVLYAGPASTPGLAAVLGGAAVSFNPEIREIFLSGEDCNANGEDDMIDLYGLPGADLNGNGVLDSCEDPASCFGACGGQTLGGCWCDELCVIFGDCCDDVDDACEFPSPPGDPDEGPWASCAGNCGGEARNGCRCDPDCVLRGDCCDDYCETCPDAEGCERIPGDVTGDGFVDVEDLVAVILGWGCTSPPSVCPADANGDGHVGVEDLVVVILNWGSGGGGGGDD